MWKFTGIVGIFGHVPKVMALRPRAAFVDWDTSQAPAPFFHNIKHHHVTSAEVLPYIFSVPSSSPTGFSKREFRSPYS